MKKVTMITVLAITGILAVSACSTADRSNELQAARGEMSGGGRQQASAIKIQFGSIGTGSDATGIESLRRFFAYAKQQGVLDSVKERAWGREGEINFCALFIDSQARYEAANSIGRIIWIGRQNGHPNAFDVVTDCDEQALEPFDGNQRGPFNQFSDNVTLTCRSTLAGDYQAVLNLKENIVSPDAIAVEMTLDQTASNARYARIQDRAASVEVENDSSASFVFHYAGHELDVRLWPAFRPVAMADGPDYYGRVSVGGRDIELQCESAQ
jgi:hypothetical protein